MRTDDAKIIYALERYKANGNNAKRTAIELNMSRTTLRSWIAASQGEEWSGSRGQPARVAGYNPAGDEKLAKKWNRVSHLSTGLVIEALEGLDAKSLKVKDIKDLAIAGAVATQKESEALGRNLGSGDRTIRIVYGIDESIRSLRELGERTVSGTPAPPEVIEGEVVSQK